MSESSEETNQTKEPTLYTLVDISTLEGVKFLKRAPMRNILIFGKLYAIDGKPTKRLDLLHDKEQLQYLFYNTTGEAPSESVDELIEQCAALATQLPVDETTMEELKSRLPAEVVEPVETHEEDEEDDMGQGGKKKDLTKGGSKKTVVKKAAKAKTVPKKSIFAGKVLTATVDENPRKTGTNGHKSFAIVLKNPGITYEDFVKKGGRSNDLAWDVDRKRIKVAKALSGEGSDGEQTKVAEQPAAPEEQAAEQAPSNGGSEIAETAAEVAQEATEVAHKATEVAEQLAEVSAPAEAPAS